ncbi:MAG: hypothetical protein INQ03_10545 [Candidatus Heimdallarchaeota archaeon]|nr:hypothetical protein [Candidatus Heimdallarchaeota archaeon]
MVLRFVYLLLILCILPVSANDVITSTYLVETGSYTVGMEDLTEGVTFTVTLEEVDEETDTGRFLVRTPTDEVTMGRSMLLDLEESLFEDNFFVLPKWEEYGQQVLDLKADGLNIDLRNASDGWGFIANVSDYSYEISWSLDGLLQSIHKEWNSLDSTGDREAYALQLQLSVLEDVSLYTGFFILPLIALIKRKLASKWFQLSDFS